MMRTAILSPLVLLLLTSTALAHGGAWRGPAGGRTPGDLTPGGSPGPSTWATTWKLGRERILDLRKLQVERLKARTQRKSARFFGEGGEGNVFQIAAAIFRE